MNLVLCNMANAYDWQQGVVNRNYFVARELIASQLFDQVLLVDFLAINPMGPIFGRRRTANYLWQCLRAFGTGSCMERIGARYRLMPWAFPGVTTRTKVQLYAGLGRAKTYEQDIATWKHVLARQGFNDNNTIVWSYNAFAPELLDIPAKLHVFDAVDDWSQHASYRKQQVQLQANYRLIDERAQLIFTVSDGLRALFPHSTTQWVPNGVAMDVFLQSGAQPKPMDIQELPKPIVGYVGTVQERIDFDLLEQVCQELPSYSFAFVGPVWSGVQARVDQLVKQCPNVHFLGRRAYNQIPAYLQAMDVGIIPHRIDTFIQSTNPMKMYDYLAAGKPVVTTPGAGTEAFANQLSIVQTPTAFIKAIRDCLKQTGEPYASQRRQAVSAHTWGSRIAQMLEALKRAMVSL